MKFFLDLIPPTVTAQEHKVMVRRGRPVFYDTPRLKAARRLYEQALTAHKPDQPLEGGAGSCGGVVFSQPHTPRG